MTATTRRKYEKTRSCNKQVYWLVLAENKLQAGEKQLKSQNNIRCANNHGTIVRCILNLTNLFRITLNEWKINFFLSLILSFIDVWQLAKYNKGRDTWWSDHENRFYWMKWEMCFCSANFVYIFLHAPELFNQFWMNIWISPN